MVSIIIIYIYIYIYIYYDYSHTHPLTHTNIANTHIHIRIYTLTQTHTCTSHHTVLRNTFLTHLHLTCNLFRHLDPTAIRLNYNYTDTERPYVTLAPKQGRFNREIAQVCVCAKRRVKKKK